MLQRKMFVITRVQKRRCVLQRVVYAFSNVTVVFRMRQKVWVQWTRQIHFCKIAPFDLFIQRFCSSGNSSFPVQKCICRKFPTKAGYFDRKFPTISVFLTGYFHPFQLFLTGYFQPFQDFLTGNFNPFQIFFDGKFPTISRFFLTGKFQSFQDSFWEHKVASLFIKFKIFLSFSSGVVHITTMRPQRGGGIETSSHADSAPYGQHESLVGGGVSQLWERPAHVRKELPPDSSEQGNHMWYVWYDFYVQWKQLRKKRKEKKMQNRETRPKRRRNWRSQRQHCLRLLLSNLKQHNIVLCRIILPIFILHLQSMTICIDSPHTPTSDVATAGGSAHHWWKEPSTTISMLEPGTQSVKLCNFVKIRPDLNEFCHFVKISQMHKVFLQKPPGTENLLATTLTRTMSYYQNV